MMDFFKLIFVLSLNLTYSSHGDCSNLYGRSCVYVPAPAGQTPPCARPGNTFCENPDGYPGELIMFLAKMARYNHRTLVTDETKEEYSATTGPYPSAKYPSYKEIDITTSLPTRNGQPQWQSEGLVPPYISKTSNYSGKFFDGFGGYQDGPVSQNGGQFLRYKYTSNIPHAQHFRDISSRMFGPSSDSIISSPLSHFRNNFLWKRDVAKFSRILDRVKRSEQIRSHMKELRESPFKKNYTGEVKYKRIRRQDGDSNDEPLCAVRTSYVMPKAAVNTEGNWMYIVNMEGRSEKYTQLVKSEVCISKSCDGICGLPLGYTSKCEQKYIQKRLIALQHQGDQLYQDTFWIPSCCVCTIRRNF